MQYYLDTEFIESPGVLQLISIGIVDEKGNSFYAISSEYNPELANDWVKANVLAKLEPESEVPRKSIARIKEELIKYLEHTGSVKLFNDNRGNPYFAKEIVETEVVEGEVVETVKYEPLPEKSLMFWGYFADYDWVLFCWIFGRMLDLPKGMPMFCMDLKQEMDLTQLPKELKPSKRGFEEHNALADAKWNRLLHKSLLVREQQSGKDNELKEAQALRDEIEIALADFTRKYNKINPEDKIDLEMKLNRTKSNNYQDKDGNPLIGKAAVTLTLNERGTKTLLASQAFGFHNEEQYEAEYDWSLKLYRGMLLEIVSSGMMLQIMDKGKK